MIKRLDGAGRLMLIERDVQGRVVRITGVADRMSHRRAEAPVTAPAAWVHGFTYNAAGDVAQEIDCTGQVHMVDADPQRRVDENRGTALTQHTHIVLDSRESSGLEARSESFADGHTEGAQK